MDASTCRALIEVTRRSAGLNNLIADHRLGYGTALSQARQNPGNVGVSFAALRDAENLPAGHSAPRRSPWRSVTCPVQRRPALSIRRAVGRPSCGRGGPRRSPIRCGQPRKTPFGTPFTPRSHGAPTTPAGCTCRAPTPGARAQPRAPATRPCAPPSPRRGHRG